MRDLEIWCVRKDKREMRGVVRERTDSRDPDTVIGVELRIEQNGAVFLTELGTDNSEIERRSAELLAELEADGWKACVEKRPH